MIKVNKKLPEKRSQLLRLAVKDAIKISQNSKFNLYMGDWYQITRWDVVLHKQVRRNICNVCMAGAVMACTLEVRPSDLNENIGPDNFQSDIKEKLYIINRLREGCIDNILLNDLDCNYFTSVQEVVINSAYALIRNNMDYKKGHANWLTYFKAASILESVGL